MVAVLLLLKARLGEGRGDCEDNVPKLPRRFSV